MSMIVRDSSSTAVVPLSDDLTQYLEQRDQQYATIFNAALKQMSNMQEQMALNKKQMDGLNDSLANEIISRSRLAGDVAVLQTEVQECKDQAQEAKERQFDDLVARREVLLALLDADEERQFSNSRGVAVVITGGISVIATPIVGAALYFPIRWVSSGIAVATLSRPEGVIKELWEVRNNLKILAVELNKEVPPEKLIEVPLGSLML